METNTKECPNDEWAVGKTISKTLPLIISITYFKSFSNLFYHKIPFSYEKSHGI